MKPRRVKGWRFWPIVNGGPGEMAMKVMGNAVGTHPRPPVDSWPLDVVPIIWGNLRGCGDMWWRAVDNNRPAMYMDHGYWHRGHYQGHYRITTGAIQQHQMRVDVPGVCEGSVPDDRMQAVTVKPWRGPVGVDGHVLLIAPSEPIQQFIKPARRWWMDTLDTLAKSTNRTLRLRQKDTERPLEADLEGAHCVITFNSNVAVEAALAGIPVHTHPISAASPMSFAMEDLEEPPAPLEPLRMAWVRSLSYSQFTLREFLGDLPWRVLQNDLPECPEAAAVQAAHGRTNPSNLMDL